MKLYDSPLVSVPVVTYNSSKTVIETLDSIYNQTYRNLELIVSDDCSTDNTVEICREWIAAHKERFVRTELLTVEKNTGVSGNMNRAERACQGEWIKVIAGDDLLMPDCVEAYVNYIEEYPDAVYVFAKVETFGCDEDRRKVIESRFLYDFFNWPIEQQYDFLTIEHNCIPASTAFYNRERINALGIRCDERIPLLEDWPRWIILLQKRVRFAFMDRITVKYRICEKSLSTSDVNSLAYDKSLAWCYLLYRFSNELKKGKKRFAILNYLRCQRVLHDNVLFWRVIVRLYKIAFMIQ